MTMPTAPADGEVMVEVTKPVNFGQLEAEIRTAVNDPEGFTCHLLGNRYDVPISFSNPANLYVRPDTVDIAAVEAAIEAHAPVPDENMPSPGGAAE